jgi:hypothetical protein
VQWIGKYLAFDLAVDLAVGLAVGLAVVHLAFYYLYISLPISRKYRRSKVNPFHDSRYFSKCFIVPEVEIHKPTYHENQNDRRYDNERNFERIVGNGQSTETSLNVTG